MNSTGVCMSTITLSTLPHLLKDQAFEESPTRRQLVRTLKRINNWRIWIRQSWCHEGNINPAESVDDLISIATSLHYLAPRLPKAQEVFQLLCDGSTWTCIKEINQACQEKLPNLISNILLPHSMRNCNYNIPKTIRESDWAKAICIE